nr:hypothetical protein Iba_chr07bCG13970 [Ipomoea batatas]
MTCQVAKEPSLIGPEQFPLSKTQLVTQVKTDKNRLPLHGVTVSVYCVQWEETSHLCHRKPSSSSSEQITAAAASSFLPFSGKTQG